MSYSQHPDDMPQPPAWLGAERILKKGDGIAALEHSYDLTAEEICVGTVLTHPEEFDVWAKHCSASDLYDPGLREMMKAFEKRWADRGAASILDVINDVANSQQRAFGLCRHVVANMEPFARSVSILSKQREVAAQLQKALDHFRKATTATEKTWALQRIDAIRVPQLEDPDVPEGRAAVLARLFAETTEGEVGGPSVRTGFRELDRAMAGGFRKAKLYVCGARPGIGKTALALQLCLPAAQVGRVAFVSLEMEEDDLLRRLASVLGQVNSYRRPTDMSETIALQCAYSTLSEIDFHVWDKPYRKWANVEEWLAGLNAERPLSLVVIDFLQLMAGHNKQREDQDITENVNMLKRLAKFLQVPILLLSQVVDESAPLPFHRYKSRDMAKSRGIEQGGDVIFFLWRPVDCPEAFDVGYAELQVTKNKFGVAPVIARLNWDGDTYTFSDSYEPVQAMPRAGF